MVVTWIDLTVEMLVWLDLGYILKVVLTRLPNGFDMGPWAEVSRKHVRFLSNWMNGDTVYRNWGDWRKKSRALSMMCFSWDAYWICLWPFIKKFFLFIYLAVLGLSWGMGDLVPWWGLEHRPPALEVQNLSDWTIRKVLVSDLLNTTFLGALYALFLHFSHFELVYFDFPSSLSL